MESLYTPQGLRSFEDRIAKLSAQSQPVWGKMNVAQMLAHVQKPLEVPLGKHQLPPMFLMKLFGGMIRKGLLGDAPVKRNNPTAPSLRITDARDFNKEKTALLQVLREFVEKGKVNQLPERHPYFGKFNAAEWEKMQAKHLDHHLQQFGV